MADKNKNKFFIKLSLIISILMLFLSFVFYSYFSGRELFFLLIYLIYLIIIAVYFFAKNFKRNYKYAITLIILGIFLFIFTFGVPTIFNLPNAIWGNVFSFYGSILYWFINILFSLYYLWKNN